MPPPVPRPPEPSSEPVPDDVTPAAPPAAGLSPQTVIVDDVSVSDVPDEDTPVDGVPPVPPAGEVPPHGTGGYGAPDWRPEYRPTPAPKAWTRWVPQTLAGRLAAGTVALVVVLVAAVGGATYYSLHSFLLNRLDQQLIQSAQSPMLKYAFLDNESPGNGRLRSPQDVYAMAVVGSRTLEPPNTSDAYALRLSGGQVTSLTNTPNVARTVRSTDGHKLRVVALPVSFEVSQDQFVPGTAIVGLRTSEIDETLHRLFLLEVAIGGAAILIALLVTTTGLRVGLGPLRRVTRTAQEVTSELSPSGGGLDRRVPATGSTTEVGQLADSFNTMLDRVETEFAARRESEERMRQFLADASHELRTPLTSIRGYAELARLERARAGTTSDSDDTLGRIETEGTRMSRLVEDLLLLARGDDAAQDPASTTERSPVDVADLVDDVTGGVHAAFPQRRIDVDVSTEPMTVLADRDQLVRVLRNLVVNACVHTDPAGTITVTAAPVAGGIELAVSDEGPGLAPQEAAHVFERFWRADKARTRARGGSGLGMAIVAQIVSAHAGQVRFDSAVATGSRVSVILPAA